MKNPYATAGDIQQADPRVGHCFTEALQPSHQGETQDTVKDASPEASPDTQNEEEAGLCQTVSYFTKGARGYCHVQ